MNDDNEKKELEEQDPLDDNQEDNVLFSLFEQWNDVSWLY